MSWKRLERSSKTYIILGVLFFALGLFLFVAGKSIFSLAAFTLAALLPVFAVGDRKESRVRVNQKEERDIVAALQDRLDSSKTEIWKYNHTIKTKDNEITELKKSLEREKEIAAEATIRADKAEADKSVPAPKNIIISGILPKAEGDDGRKQVLDITDVIKCAADDFRSAAEEADVIINIAEPSEPMYVSAAPVMLRTMFRDIIDNALKYMMRSGVLQITIASLDDDIFVAMKDNGKGLDESETGHIFELNYQGSNRVSGNGLGLAQVKAIVDHYGGMIYAKSSPGRGMGIYLHLPAVRV